MESLLSSHAQVPPDFLDVAPVVREMAARWDRIEAAAALEPGLIFAGKFRLVRRLGAPTLSLNPANAT